MKKFKSEIGLEFKGAVKWGKVFRYAVFAEIFDDDEIIGGTRIANFNRVKFAKKCRDQVNQLDSRYNAHVFKMPLSKRIQLKYYTIKRKIKKISTIVN